jgi:DNA-binding NarL/FixJ family response regulator
MGPFSLIGQTVEIYTVQMRVVILSSHLLFAEGIASRLHQHLQQITHKIVDPRQPDAMAQIIAARPSIVILDVTDAEVNQFCSLSQLLLSLPGGKVIRLDPQQERIQVVTSEQHPAIEVRDLIEVIEALS